VLNKEHPEKSFTMIIRPWPKNNNPFTNSNAPIVLLAEGKQIPGWKIDEYGLCPVLPQSPVATGQPRTPLAMVPMGGARLRISAFPVVE
jgi:hypothetical protein